MTVEERLVSLERRVLTLEEHCSLVEKPTTKKHYSWDTRIKSNRYSTYDNIKTEKCWYFGCTNENRNFSKDETCKGSMCDFHIGHPIWGFAFHPKSDGTHQVGLFLDKLNFNFFRECYSFVGFTENWEVNYRTGTFSLKAPRLNKEIFLDVDIALGAFTCAGTNKCRVMIGAVSKWMGKDHYVAYNIKRTTNFGGDSYHSNFDRHWDCKVSEGCYYSPNDVWGVEHLLPETPTEESFKKFTIPITTMFKRIDWSDKFKVEDGYLAGVWLGMEIFGAAVAWIEFKNWDIWSEE